MSVGLKDMPLNLLIALDQMLNVVFCGWPDETLSCRAYRCEQHTNRKGWTLTRRVIDGLFFWQKDHCKAAYESEQHRNHLPPRLR